MADLLPYNGLNCYPKLLFLDLADVLPIDNGMSLINLMAGVIAIVCFMVDVICHWWLMECH